MLNFISNFLRKCLVIAIGSLLLFSFYVPYASTDTFDFTANDLISRESFRKVSLDFKDANLTNVLKVFSEQAGLNFIAAQGVKDRTVTLFLDNVTLQEALDKIMSANNLKYELEPGSNIFIVKEWGRPGVETETKIYSLKYTRLTDSTLQKAIDAGGAGTLASSSSSTSSGSSSAATGGIEATIKGVLTTNGKLVSDVRTNSIVVTDIPTQFAVIDKVVEMLDVATPQVMIEVEMLDVAKSTMDNMGVTYANNGQIVSISGSSAPTRFPNLFSRGTDVGTTIPAFGYGTLSTAVFQATLNLMTTDTKTKVLARPRIMTLSNETAEIKITTQEAIGNTQIITSVEGTGTTTNEAERYETGVKLRVTPQVDMQTGNITMFLEPVVAEVSPGGTFDGKTYNNPETRSSTTTLRIKDGETIVVGGLIKNKDTSTIKKLPFLGDIPFIGAAFRHKESEVSERELIVFITPHIIGNKNASTFPGLDLAMSAAVPTGVMPYREQTSAVLHKDSVDNSLRKWDR